MTRNEMLEQAGLTDEDLKDLVQRFHAFHRSLNERQRAAVNRSLPSTAAAAATFGPDVTAEQLGDLIGFDAGPGALSPNCHIAVVAKAK
jgi:hypothetical protein